MFDLGLTSSGDLIFEKNTINNKPIHISFNVSKGPVLNVKFKIEDCDEISGGPNSLKVSFDVGDMNKDKKAMVIYDTAAIVQGVKIRLQSSLGEIQDRETIGSKLELLKHSLLYDSTTSNNAITYVKEAIADILPDAEVRVNPTVIKNENGYCQKLVINIYDKGFLIFKYDLKG